MQILHKHLQKLLDRTFKIMMDFFCPKICDEEAIFNVTASFVFTWYFSSFAFLVETIIFC